MTKHGLTTGVDAWNETHRLSALYSYGILDTEAETAFDDLAKVAAHVCQAPIALVNFIDQGRQWFKAETGLGMRETPLDVSICAHAILHSGLFVVPDTTVDPRFKSNPMVTGEPHLRFYAGARLETPDGLPLGTLCVLDTAPRPTGLTPQQAEMLSTLARTVMSLLQLRRSNAVLVQREDRYRMLIEGVKEHAIILLDTEGVVSSWSPAAQKFQGYTAEEILGQPFSRFYTREDQAAGEPERALEIADREGKYETQGWRVRKDGTHYWARVLLDGIHDGDGRLIGYAKVTRDITEQHRADEALRESEERFRLLVQGVTDYAIYMLDPEGRVTNWNAGAERLKGYHADEVTGQHYSMFFTPEDRAAGLPETALTTAARMGNFEHEGWRLRKDGSRFLSDLVVNRIDREDGSLLGFANITRDITERRKLELQLIQAQKLEAIGALTGGLAHDFNNLLTVIIGNAEILADDAHDAPSRSLAQVILDAAESGASLTQRLLTFARRQSLDLEYINLADVLGDMVGLLHRTLGEHVELKTEFLDVGTTLADKALLESAVLNLAINARDAMPKGGTLTIATGQKTAGPSDGNLPAGQSVVYLTVADTGTGMPREVLERAYEPFFTTKEIGHGSGLGLSMVYGFVQQSGGHISIKSHPGQGTCVTILLRSVSSNATDQTTKAAPTDSMTGSGRILLVEDEQHVRAYVASQLESLGYEVVTVSDGPSALRLIERGPAFDLLFSDVVLPKGMGGVEIAREARIRSPGLKVLLTSGYSEEAFKALGRPEKDMPLLRKPFRRRELALAVQAALRSK